MEGEEITEPNNQLTSDNDLEIQIFEIERIRNEYVEKGDYDKAEECISKIKELKQSLQKRKKRELESQQVSEIDNLSASYKVEIENTNNDWDNRMVQFNEKYQKLEESLNERQLKEMEDLFSSLETKFNQKPKSSRDYLRYEQEEHQLVKFQRFKEAGVIRKKKEIQRQKDVDNWNMEKNIKIRNQAVQKSNKHLTEKNSFKKKYEIELEILKKQRNDETKRIQKKFQNKKLELDMQQKSERNLTEKEFTNKIKKIRLDNNTNSTEGSYQSRVNTNNCLQRNDIKDRQIEDKQEIYLDQNPNQEDENSNDEENHLNEHEDLPEEI